MQSATGANDIVATELYENGEFITSLRTKLGFLKQAQLPESFQEAITFFAQPCIKMHLTKDLKLNSYLGGTPQLPLQQEWPRWKGESLAFPSGHIDLSQIPQSSILPDTGSISIFYEAWEQPFGGYTDEGGHKIFYFSEDQILHEREYPQELAEKVRFSSRNISFTVEASLPDVFLTADMNAIVQGDEEELWDNMYDPLTNQIAGIPTFLKRPPAMQCPSRGDPSWEIEEIDNNLIAKELTDWQLLIQLGSIDNGDFEWDWLVGGNLYFMIQKEHLKARNFGHTWCIAESNH